MAEQDTGKSTELALQLNELTKNFTYQEIHLAFALFFSGIAFSLIEDQTEFSYKNLEDIIQKYPNTYPGYLSSIALSLIDTAKLFKE